MKALESPVVKKRETEFHDFGKRLRSVWTMLQCCPDLYGTPPSARDLDPRVVEVVHRLGDIEERLVSWHLAKNHGDRAAAQHLEGEIELKWAELRLWRKNAPVGHLLSGLLEHLR